MTSVYVAVYVEQGDHSRILGVYGQWQALAYGVGKSFDTLNGRPTAEALRNDPFENSGLAEWSIPLGNHPSVAVHITKQPVHTAVEDEFEVRVRYTTDGLVRDEVFRTSDTISDKSHAAALAAGWNEDRPWGMPKDAEFYAQPLA